MLTIRSYRKPVVMASVTVVGLFFSYLVFVACQERPFTGQVISIVFGLLIILCCIWFGFICKELDGYYIRTKLLGVELGRFDIRDVYKIYKDVCRDAQAHLSLSLWVVAGSPDGKDATCNFRPYDTNLGKIFKRILEMRPGQVEVDPSVQLLIRESESRGIKKRSV